MTHPNVRPRQPLRGLVGRSIPEASHDPQSTSPPRSLHVHVKALAGAAVLVSSAVAIGTIVVWIFAPDTNPLLDLVSPSPRTPRHCWEPAPRA